MGGSNKLLMTYSDAHNKLSGPYLDMYQNSLIFDKDRCSIYTQQQEFGYISSIHIGEQENINTRSELYNNDTFTDSIQVLTNVSFDRINGFTYTYSNITTVPTTQSATVNNTIITVSIKDGTITLESYKPSEVVGINVCYNNTYLNTQWAPTTNLNKIYPLVIGTDLIYDKVQVIVNSTEESPLYESIIVDRDGILDKNENHWLIGSGTVYSPKNNKDQLQYIFGTPQDFELIDDIETDDASNYYISNVTTIDSNLNAAKITINYPVNDKNEPCAGVTIDVVTAIEDKHQRLTNPPTSAIGKITFGWYYVLYYTPTMFVKLTESLFNNEKTNGNTEFTKYNTYNEYSTQYDEEWLNAETTTVFIQNDQNNIYYYDRNESVEFNMLSDDNIDSLNKTRAMYLYVPTKLAHDKIIKYYWNNWLSQNPIFYNTRYNGINLGTTFIIKNIEYTVYCFDTNHNVEWTSQITLAGYMS